MRKKVCLIAAAETGPEAMAEMGELAELMAACCWGLPARQRTAVLLRYVEGSTLGEIGAALRIRPASAHQLIERALRRMRGQLARVGILRVGDVL